MADDAYRRTWAASSIKYGILPPAAGRGSPPALIFKTPVSRASDQCFQDRAGVAGQEGATAAGKVREH